MDSQEEKVPESFFKKNYQIILGIFGFFIFFLLVGSKKPVIKIEWIALIIVALVIYLIYKSYSDKMKYEDITQMSNRIKIEETVRTSGKLKLNASRDNINVEEIGLDRWLIHFVDEGLSYIRSPSSGKTIGLDYRLPYEIRKDYQKLVINRAIAEGKIKNIKVED